MTDESVRAISEALTEIIEAQAVSDDRTARARSYRIHEVKELLAEEFGRRYGWRRAQRSFNLYALRNRGVFDGRWNSYSQDWPDSLHYDHAYHYRTADKRAVAIAAHLYSIARDIESWAEDHGLVVSYPSFPSWWYPGRTKLVVYTSVWTGPAQAILEGTADHEEAQR